MQDRKQVLAFEHENDFAYHPNLPQPPQKLNVSNILAVAEPILKKLLM